MANLRRIGDWVEIPSHGFSQNPTNPVVMQWTNLSTTSMKIMWEMEISSVVYRTGSGSVTFLTEATFEEIFGVDDLTGIKRVNDWVKVSSYGATGNHDPNDDLVDLWFNLKDGHIFDKVVNSVTYRASQGGFLTDATFEEILGAA